jgi:hypothetical protein
MLWRYAQHLFHSYGSLRLERGDLAAASAYAEECLYAATATDSPKNIVKARRLRGQVFLVREELNLAAAELTEALKLARRLGNPPQLYRTLAAVGDLRRAGRNPAAAQRAYRRALAVVDGVATQLPNSALRERFLSSQEVQGIRWLADTRFGSRCTDTTGTPSKPLTGAIGN